MNLTIEKKMMTQSNVVDADRQHTVRGDIYATPDGKFEAVRNGQVFSKTDGQYIAWFNAGVSEPLNISFAVADTDTSTDAQTAVINDIMDFISSAKEAFSESQL